MYCGKNMRNGVSYMLVLDAAFFGPSGLSVLPLAAYHHFSVQANSILKMPISTTSKRPGRWNEAYSKRNNVGDESDFLQRPRRCMEATSHGDP